MSATTNDGAPTGASDKSEFSAPYIPFRTLLSAIERMKQESIPARLDRSYLSNLPWGSQNHFLASCRSLGLIDADGKPTPLLVALVERPEDRPALMDQILRENYPGPMALGTNATQEQLDEQFRKYGLTGSTMRKAVAFYLHAAAFAKVPLSPHFRAPRTTERSASSRRKTKARQDDAPQPTPSQPPTVHGDLHPFLQGLLKELPAEDSWTKDKRDKWLQMAELTVDMLYKVSDKE